MNNKHEMLVAMVAISIMGLFIRPANAGLVACWKLDDASGSIASDSSGNDNVGKLRGNPVWVTGRIGGALEFDGMDDFIDVDRRIVTGSFSFALWLKYDALKSRYVSVMHNDVWVPGSVHVHLRNTRLFNVSILGASEEKNINSNAYLSLSRWYHLVTTYDSSRDIVRIYINGQFDTEEVSVSPAATPWIGSMNIGAWRNRERYFDGIMDDICIFDHVLNNDEVKQLYTHGCGSFIPMSLQKLINENQKAKLIAEKQGHQKAVVYLEEKIAEFGLWEAKNTDDIGSRENLFSSKLYFLLAKAKEGNNAPIQEVAAAYKKSISQAPFGKSYVSALLWLFENSSVNEYTDAVKESVCSSDSATDDLSHIARDFESIGNWFAFKLFLDALFSQVDNPACYAVRIAKGLEKNGLWDKRFAEYAQNKPELVQYLINILEVRAQENIAQNNFLKAAEIYRKIMNQYDSGQNKINYGLKACECTLKSGKYYSILSELKELTNNYEFIDNSLVAQAMMLKGQVYLQLSEFDHARDTFTQLIRKCPETEQAPEASFFIGYCNMLQGKYAEASEALRVVIENYPRDPFANKAHLCLERIKKVTK